MDFALWAKICIVFNFLKI